MSIEQRIADALADLEAMLTDGADADDAVAVCARDYDLKIEALTVQARKVFGDLSSFRERNLRKAEILARDHKAETAISRYLAEGPEPNFPAWFETEIGRPPTKTEMAEFRDRYLQYLVSKIDFNL